jgi:hypothetical protein
LIWAHHFKTNADEVKALALEIASDGWQGVTYEYQVYLFIAKVFEMVALTKEVEEKQNEIKLSNTL